MVACTIKVKSNVHLVGGRDSVDDDGHAYLPYSHANDRFDCPVADWLADILLRACHTWRRLRQQSATATFHWAEAFGLMCNRL